MQKNRVILKPYWSFISPKKWWNSIGHICDNCKALKNRPLQVSLPQFLLIRLSFTTKKVVWVLLVIGYRVLRWTFHIANFGFLYNHRARLSVLLRVWLSLNNERIGQVLVSLWETRVVEGVAVGNLVGCGRGSAAWRWNCGGVTDATVGILIPKISPIDVR